MPVSIERLKKLLGADYIERKIKSGEIINLIKPEPVERKFESENMTTREQAQERIQEQKSKNMPPLLSPHDVKPRQSIAPSAIKHKNKRLNTNERPIFFLSRQCEAKSEADFEPELVEDYKRYKKHFPALHEKGKPFLKGKVCDTFSEYLKDCVTMLINGGITSGPTFERTVKLVELDKILSKKI